MVWDLDDAIIFAANVDSFMIILIIIKYYILM